MSLLLGPKVTLVDDSMFGGTVNVASQFSLISFFISIACILISLAMLLGIYIPPLLLVSWNPEVQAESCTDSVRFSQCGWFYIAGHCRVLNYVCLCSLRASSTLSCHYDYQKHLHRFPKVLSCCQNHSWVCTTGVNIARPTWELSPVIVQHIPRSTQLLSDLS